MLDPRILNPLKDASFWTALGTTVAGEVTAVQSVHGIAVAAPMLVAMLPLLVWMRGHAKHRLAALDVALELARIAEQVTPAETGEA